MSEGREVSHDVIRDYDPAWPRAFDTECKRICTRLGDGLEAIEHIGSTSVPGLAAKPLIDMMVSVRTVQLQGCIDKLAQLGYRTEARAGRPPRPGPGLHPRKDGVHPLRSQVRWASTAERLGERVTASTIASVAAAALFAARVAAR